MTDADFGNFSCAVHDASPSEETNFTFVLYVISFLLCLGLPKMFFQIDTLLVAIHHALLAERHGRR